MRNRFSQYKSQDLWSIKEEYFKKSLQNVRESQFTLGNGYICARGVLEEIPVGSRPGTFLAGIYDRLTSQVAELVNFPNPFFFKFTVKGEKFGAVAMDTLEHKRILNMQNGLLIRRTVYSDVKNRRYDYQSIRFISMADKHIGGMQIVLTPLDGDIEFEVQSQLDTSVVNSGLITEGEKRHFHVRELGRDNESTYHFIETLEKKHYLVFRNGLSYKIDRKKNYATGNILRLKLKKGQHAVFTLLFYINSFTDISDAKRIIAQSKKALSKAMRAKFDSLLKNHIDKWRKLWQIADARIDNTNDIQRNLRFNIYHMLICDHFDNGFSSIGARTLSGEGYRGHVFWDAEIFMIPFYSFVLPQVAKNMLLYRFNRLSKARSIAKQKGYKGAMFPWESAGSGEEETPTWAKDLDGKIIRIKTNDLEHHITACIAYAFYKYTDISGDWEFMDDYGYEVIFETARFWASRVKENNRGKYDIKDVIGPDEFHEHVNNNAFTNGMAGWNLKTAFNFYRWLRQNRQKLHSYLKEKLKLTDKEVERWRKIANNIEVKIRKNCVIDQFDGFHRKKYIEIINYDENGIPLLPEGVKVQDYNKTQLIKQPDVLMLMHLLPSKFDKKTKESNFWFYNKRTLHKSSLSPAIHSIIAARIGSLSLAYQYFNVALRADISDLHGNTSEGIHAASLGGVWSALFYGFAGISQKEDILSFDPFMPKTWKKIKLSFIWRKIVFKIKTNNNMVKIEVQTTRKKVKVKVFNKIHNLAPNKEYKFLRPKSRALQNYYL